MDQAKDYNARIEDVRALLEARLGFDPENADRFGNGLFVYGGPEYGEQGEMGSVVWYVTRSDDALHRRRRETFEWRAYTPQAVADALLKAYEELGS